MCDHPAVLYVEDEPFSRQVMQMLLVRGLGFKHVTIFEDSTDFMTRVENLALKPNLIMLDIHMQPFDGFKMLHLLREHHDYRQARIVAVTASVMNEEIELLKSAGFDGGIGKPIDQNFLPEFLDRILNGEQIWHVT
mgnify:CR=1 FL=1